MVFVEKNSDHLSIWICKVFILKVILFNKNTFCRYIVLNVNEIAPATFSATFTATNLAVSASLTACIATLCASLAALSAALYVVWWQLKFSNILSKYISI